MTGGPTKRAVALVPKDSLTPLSSVERRSSALSDPCMHIPLTFSSVKVEDRIKVTRQAVLEADEAWAKQGPVAAAAVLRRAYAMPIAHAWDLLSKLSTKHNWTRGSLDLRDCLAQGWYECLHVPIGRRLWELTTSPNSTPATADPHSGSNRYGQVREWRQRIADWVQASKPSLIPSEDSQHPYAAPRGVTWDGTLGKIQVDMDQFWKFVTSLHPLAYSKQVEVSHSAWVALQRRVLCVIRGQNTEDDLILILDPLSKEPDVNFLREVEPIAGIRPKKGASVERSRGLGDNKNLGREPN